MTRGHPAVSRPAGAMSLPGFAEALSAIKAFHVLLVGPRGTGKTTLARKLAHALGREMCTIQGHADLSTEDIRSHICVRSGETIVKDGPLLRAVRTNSLLFFDEPNLARSGMVALMNNALSGGTITVPETDEELVVPPDFRCVMACNEGYRGTHELNEALKDRFRVVYVDYWAENVEVQALRERYPRMTEPDVRRMVQVANAVRAAAKQGDLEFDFSFRTLEQWVQDADERTQSQLTSFESVVLPKVGTTVAADAQRQLLKNIAYMFLEGFDAKPHEEFGS